MLTPTADAGVQIGGNKGPKAAKKLDTGAILNRIRVSYTTLRATKVDSALRGLILSEIITQIYNEGGSMVVLQGLRF